MAPALLYPCLAAACLAAVSAAIVWGMTHAGVIDVPGARSSHDRPTPKGGGLGIVTAFLLGLGMLWAAGVAGPFAAVALATAAIAAVSWLDDLLAWPAWVKLAAQVAAAGVAVAGGVWVAAVRLPGVGIVPLGWLGPAGTLAWVLLAANAMNFIDGLNGLASGVALVACLALAAAAAACGAWFAGGAALGLAAGLAGFLPFNFPRARIFMGDVGSQPCGLALAVLAVALDRAEGAVLGIALMPMLLSGVLFDVAFTLARRAAAGERLMQAHRGHLYQVAHRSGLSAVRVALLHWGFAAWGGACYFGLAHAAGWWKLAWLLLVVPPQLAWLGWVRRRAAGARVARW